MQRLSGVLMVLAGVGLGGYMLLPAHTDTAETLAEVTRIATSSTAPSDTVPFSPASQSDAPRPGVPRIVLDAAPANTVKKPATGVRVFSPASPLMPPEPEPAAAAANKWTAVVTTELAGAAKLTSPKPGDADARAHLTSDLQRELKRVGCYGGEINGAWTQNTKRAMSAFMERVNASLPVDDPDYILLTLVQGHTAIACGTDCPAGEVQSYTGKCLPQAVVAQASRKMQRYEDRREERRLDELRRAQQQGRLAGEQRAANTMRMANTQPPQRDPAQHDLQQRDKAQRLAAAASAKADELDLPSAQAVKPQQTAAAKPEQLPWLDNDGATDQQRRAAARSAVRTEPLPGRMAVGGPIAPRPELPADAGLTGRDQTGEIQFSPDNTADADALRRALPPTRQAALQQYPSGFKAGPAATATSIDGTTIEPAFRKYSPAKIVHRPPPSGYYLPKVYGTKYFAKPKVKRYAYNPGGKTRRGQPRPGTPRFNLMQSLGGIY
jgi:hypothetical protein